MGKTKAGKKLEELMTKFNMGKEDIGDLQPYIVNSILKGARITPAVAQQLEKVFNIKAYDWIKMSMEMDKEENHADIRGTV